MRLEKDLLETVHDSIIRWARDFPGVYRNQNGSLNKNELRRQMLAYNGIRCNIVGERFAADYLESLDRPEKLRLIDTALAIY
jgi:hypothetical protein